jgi:predicted RNase H-like HicB family nuclease
MAEVRYVLMDIHDANPLPPAQVVHEAGGWSAFIPGLPIAADGATSEEATDELVDAIREYAEDWHDRLRHAPNHQENREIVQLVEGL